MTQNNISPSILINSKDAFVSSKVKNPPTLDINNSRILSPTQESLLSSNSNRRQSPIDKIKRAIYNKLKSPIKSPISTPNDSHLSPFFNQEHHSDVVKEVIKKSKKLQRYENGYHAKELMFNEKTCTFRKEEYHCLDEKMVFVFKDKPQFLGDIQEIQDVNGNIIFHVRCSLMDNIIGRDVKIYDTDKNLVARAKSDMLSRRYKFSKYNTAGKKREIGLMRPKNASKDKSKEYLKYVVDQCGTPIDADFSVFSHDKTTYIENSAGNVVSSVEVKPNFFHECCRMKVERDQDAIMMLLVLLSIKDHENIMD